MAALQMLKRRYFELRGKADFLRLVRDPSSTDVIFAMTESLRKATPPEQFTRYMEIAYRDPRMEAAYQRKYWPKLPARDELRAMPPASFGHELAIFADRWNLDFDLFPEPKLENKSDYILSRMYHAHDAWHVLTGYDTSVPDELALQAFGVAQNKLSLGLLLVTGGLLHILNNDPERGERALGLIVEGYARGQAARQLLIEPVFERLEEPLEKVRADLGLIPRAGA